MSVFTDLLAGLQANPVLRERVALAEEKFKALEEENRKLREQVASLTAQNLSLKALIPAPKAEEPRELDDIDIVSVLQTWMQGRTDKENTSVIFYSDVDREHRLPAGSAERLLEQAARKLDFHVEQKGSSTIKFVYVLPASHAPCYSNPSIREMAPRIFARR